MEEIIKQAKSGNQAAIEQLVTRYKGLIRSYANKFYLVGGDKDDLLQEGMLGLFYAITYYDEDKGAFPSFVELCVLRQVLDAVKRDNGAKQKPLKNYVELDVAANLSDGTNSPLEYFLRKEYAEKVTRLIKEKLTPYERKVLTLFADGYSYDDIAVKTNKSYKAVDGALQRARRKLLEYKE
ncbi:MAG: sigma-70 family RNA polymerase sigma factor [Clostridiales bacterium]|nr:sigma-70 family RNA polymerase sigma factor [Clostridiales bacterium]